MSSSDHVGFQKSTFKVNMVVTQCFVASGQDLNGKSNVFSKNLYILTIERFIISFHVLFLNVPKIYRFISYFYE